MPSRQTGSSAAPRNRTNTRAASAARDDVITMLKDDHKQVKKLFREFEKLDVHEDPERCQALVMQACTDLEVHAALEEELFYPAARNGLSEEELVDEAEVEHMSAKMLIAQLKEMTPEDEKYAATFKVLGEYIKHHIGEEEKEMFPQLAKAKLDWQQLQGDMVQRREALLSEHMVLEEGSMQGAEMDAEIGSATQQRDSGGRGKGRKAQSGTEGGRQPRGAGNVAPDAESEIASEED